MISLYSPRPPRGGQWVVEAHAPTVAWLPVLATTPPPLPTLKNLLFTPALLIEAAKGAPESPAAAAPSVAFLVHVMGAQTQVAALDARAFAVR